MSLLEDNDLIRKLFGGLFDGDNIDQDISDKIPHYILRTFSRMQGKDHVRNLMAKGKIILKLHIRQSMAAALDNKMFKKIRRQEKENSKDENDTIEENSKDMIEENSEDEIRDHQEILL